MELNCSWWISSNTWGGLIVINSAVSQQLFEKKIMSLSEWQSGGNLKFAESSWYAYKAELEDFNIVLQNRRDSQYLLADLG